MDKLTKNALQKILQNVTGKSIAVKHYETTLDVLNAYNALYECVVTFSLTPSTAKLVLKQGTTVIEPNEDGTYSVKEGTYTYDVSNAGYVSKTAQSLTITNSDETTGSKTVEVSLTKYCVVTFAPKDSVSEELITGATIVVKKGATTITANANGTYNLVADTYAFDISKTGYVAQTAVELVVSAGDVSTGTKTITTALVANN
jgi:hypothetical protein